VEFILEFLAYYGSVAEIVRNYPLLDEDDLWQAVLYGNGLQFTDIGMMIHLEVVPEEDAR
jgi:uncharacterized protein (DUF433 family)